MAGGVLSAVNGATHFVLPLVYPAGGWAPHVEGLYEPVRWALYATAVFFGVLLVLAGALTVVVARAASAPRRMVAWVAGGMAAFWLLAAGYELVVPFPIHEARWALPAFSLIVAGLYVVGLWLRLLPLRSDSFREPEGPGGGPWWGTTAGGVNGTTGFGRQ